jgi:hypothetical protein
MQMLEKLSNLSKILQFDEDSALLSEDRDNSSNQCYCVSSRVKRNRSLNEENEIDIESYQKD